MFSLTPSRDSGEGRIRFGHLVSDRIDAGFFRSAIRRFDRRFAVYAQSCPQPLPAPGLVITPEIRCQCERYLPLNEITPAFNHLYRTALNYPPILSSTPFHNALSWADVFSLLPPQFQFSANPARLLEKLLTDRNVLHDFLFASFLPRRFYGNSDRYPLQRAYVRKWLNERETRSLNCLDAACGIGEETFAMAKVLRENGYQPKNVRIEGWTLEPLEVWCAAHGRFPSDRRRDDVLRSETADLFEHGYATSMTFRCANLLEPCPAGRHSFNLILCNGLLGGPLLCCQDDLQRVVNGLCDLLTPGGLLLAADNFHGGWKRRWSPERVREMFERQGLTSCVAGEGIGASRVP